MQTANVGFTRVARRLPAPLNLDEEFQSQSPCLKSQPARAKISNILESRCHCQSSEWMYQIGVQNILFEQLHRVLVMVSIPWLCQERSSYKNCEVDTEGMDKKVIAMCPCSGNGMANCYLTLLVS